MLSLLAMLLQEYAIIGESWKKNMLVGKNMAKQECNLWGLCYASFPLLFIVSPGSMWSPLLDFQEAILKDISQVKKT